MTFFDGSQARPVFADDDSSIWAFDNSATDGPEVLRFSLTNGSLLQRAAVPGIRKPVVATNGDGLWLGTTNEEPVRPGFRTGVYLVQIGAARARLIQSTNDFVWDMFGSGKTMDVVEGAKPSGLTVEYRIMARPSSA